MKLCAALPSPSATGMIDVASYVSTVCPEGGLKKRGVANAASRPCISQPKTIVGWSFCLSAHPQPINLVVGGERCVDRAGGYNGVYNVGFTVEELRYPRGRPV